MRFKYMYFTTPVKTINVIGDQFSRRAYYYEQEWSHYYNGQYNKRYYFIDSFRSRRKIIKPFGER